MMNRRELEMTLGLLKAEYMEALERGNARIQENIVNQILNLEVTLKEDKTKKIDLTTEVEFVVDEKEVLRQGAIVKSFTKKLKELYVKVKTAAEELRQKNGREAI